VAKDKIRTVFGIFIQEFKEALSVLVANDWLRDVGTDVAVSHCTAARLDRELENERLLDREFSRFVCFAVLHTLSLGRSLETAGEKDGDDPVPIADELGFSNRISSWFNPEKDMLCSLSETARNPRWKQMTDSRREASRKRRVEGSEGL